MSARAIAAVAVVAMLACNRHKVTVPLDTPEATQCADACEVRHGKRPDLRRTCLASCPGAREASGACTDDEQPPAFACAYETKMKPAAAAAFVAGLVVFAAAAAVVLVLSAGADTIDDDPP